MNSPPQDDRQKDHELGIRVVMGSIVKEGYTIEAVNRDPEQMPQIVASKDEHRFFFIVLTERYTMPSLPEEIRSQCVAHAAKFGAACMFAPVSLYAAGAQSPEGEEGFFVKYSGHSVA